MAFPVPTTSPVSPTDGGQQASGELGAAEVRVFAFFASRDPFRVPPQYTSPDPKTPRPNTTNAILTKRIPRVLRWPSRETAARRDGPGRSLSYKALSSTLSRRRTGKSDSSDLTFGWTNQCPHVQILASIGQSFRHFGHGSHGFSFRLAEVLTLSEIFSTASCTNSYLSSKLWNHFRQRNNNLLWGREYRFALGSNLSPAADLYWGSRLMR